LFVFACGKKWCTERDLCAGFCQEQRSTPHTHTPLTLFFKNCERIDFIRNNRKVATVYLLSGSCHSTSHAAINNIRLSGMKFWERAYFCNLLFAVFLSRIEFSTCLCLFRRNSLAIHRSEQRSLTINLNFFKYRGGAIRSSLSTANYLHEKYENKTIVFQPTEHVPGLVMCCGTLHVSRQSAVMISDVIRVWKPDVVVLELCPSRIDSILLGKNDEQNASFTESLYSSIKQRSVLSVVGFLFSWAQQRLASVIGSPVGDEQRVAFDTAKSIGATVVLGDRDYTVTMQRVNERMNIIQKLKLICALIWDALWTTTSKMTSYVKNVDSNASFLQDEMDSFYKFNPELADIVVGERDEYIAQTIIEICRASNSFAKLRPNADMEAQFVKVLAVVGAGHLRGINRILQIGGVNHSRFEEISSTRLWKKSARPGIHYLKF
jgi:pheromone shutdown protein TraB